MKLGLLIEVWGDANVQSLVSILDVIKDLLLDAAEV